MIDRALKQLISGILICGGFFQIIFIWFSESKLHFSLGLWLGVGISLFMAWHIHYSLNNALDMQEGDAGKYMYRMYAIRMAVVLVVFFLAAYFKVCSMAGVLLGMFSLKLGAYLQPLFQKITKKRR